MGPITVRKLDHTGREVISYPGDVLERSGNAIVIQTSWDRGPLDLDFVVLEPGDLWIEIFYSNRWYNVFEIHASDGRLKGWYCNITRPAHISEEDITAEDLALDLWVAPDGSMQVLDEDEFIRLELPPAERKAAREALGQLVEMARQKAPPFDGR